MRSGGFRFEGPRGERQPPSRRSHERMMARAERRRRNSRRMMTIAFGAVPLLIAVIAALIFWPDAESPAPQPPPGKTAKPTKLARVAAMDTGVPLEATSTDGFEFSFAGVRAGVTGTVPYADYVIANTGSDEALFETPVDLFVRSGAVPKGVQCNLTTGVEGACSPRNKAKLIGPVGDSPQLRKEGEDWYMPPGSSYLVRVTVAAEMKQGVTPDDVSLWLWASRFYRDRTGHSVPIPK
ncbi:hypothetical protein GCM10027589_49190 [Actinocorallia lasiicapitis]